MAFITPRRLPRGINFILGGTVATIALLGFFLISGSFDFGGFGAPDVRIDGPTSERAS